MGMAFPTHWNFLESESETCSVMSNSLRPYELYSSWNLPGQNTGMSSLSPLQGIFPTQGSNPGLPHCRQILYQSQPKILYAMKISLKGERSKERSRLYQIFKSWKNLLTAILNYKNCWKTFRNENYTVNLNKGMKTTRNGKHVDNINWLTDSNWCLYMNVYSNTIHNMQRKVKTRQLSFNLWMQRGSTAT